MVPPANLSGGSGAKGAAAEVMRYARRSYDWDVGTIPADCHFFWWSAIITTQNLLCASVLGRWAVFCARMPQDFFYAPIPNKAIYIR